MKLELVRKRFPLVWLVAVLAALSAPLAAEDAKGAKPSPLAAYVSKEDDSYGWVKRRNDSAGGGAVIELTLTSQTWKGIRWQHQLFIIKPSKMDNARQAVLMIAGGRWKPENAGPIDPAKKDLPREAQALALVAEQLRSPVAVLMHCPFQPIFDGKVEDEIIAHTFDQYLKTGDEEWPLLLPMTKSAVRAMDAVQEFAKQEWNVEVKGFTVTGGSKRGWTTWLTGAVDPRVTALAPMVIDVLNMQAQMKHQMATWGKYSEQIEDYTRLKIQERSDSPEGRKLNTIVDPYTYRENYKQPKMIILATNDRYWPVDALNVYWDGLPGEKHVLYCPNQGHGIKDLVRVLGGVSAVHRSALGELTLPKMTWDLSTEGKMSLSLASDKKPKAVVCWLATSPTKDFREAKWESFSTEESGGKYRFERAVPESGYAAFFGEAEFDEGGTFFLSTNLRIAGGKK
ncbi:MAG: PhoPQ-activated pathogenicity protein [Planctomycetia bacterium]|nr:PhoPQ-activated pathogenicity protein [Planctomycetia bacterium]